MIVFDKRCWCFTENALSQMCLVVDDMTGKMIGAS